MHSSAREILLLYVEEYVLRMYSGLGGGEGGDMFLDEEGLTPGRAGGGRVSYPTSSKLEKSGC